MTEERGHEARIVVGVDGSPESKAALRWALKMSSTTGLAVDAVSAWQIPAAYGWSTVPPDWRPDDEAMTTLKDTIREVAGTHTPDHVKAIVVEGNPAKVLIDMCDVDDMLVVGSRGLGGFAEMLLGSVSSTCVRHAKCPVLVVHDHPK